MKITKIVVILGVALISAVEASRSRHVQSEWNSDALCLENDFSQILNKGGWYFSPWLHAYFQTPEWWIYHCDKGWLFPESDGNQGAWFYWANKETWVWTRGDVYPLAFNAEENSWFNFCVTPESTQELPVEKFIVRKVIAPS